MRFGNVCLESIAAVLPEEIWTSAGIEERLRPLYERLKLPFGRLELMTGIRERRGWPEGRRPSEASAAAAPMLAPLPSSVCLQKYGSARGRQRVPPFQRRVERARAAQRADAHTQQANAPVELDTFEARPGGGHPLRIADLMILGRMRIGNQHGGHPGRGELGLHGHWVKLMLHYLFIYKAKARPGWQLIPE